MAVVAAAAPTKTKTTQHPVGARTCRAGAWPEASDPNRAPRRARARAPIHRRRRLSAVAVPMPPLSSIRGDAKKVDFCIAIRQSGVDRHPAIADINMSESVNHSNHPSLLSNPIAISIETKAASPNQEEAELQMGVWMTAHFSRLRALLARQCDRRPGLSSQRNNPRTQLEHHLAASH